LIEADFFQYYGLDIAKLGQPGLSLGRFESLVKNLPRESRTVQKIVGERVSWGESEHLLASLIDAVQLNSWIAANVYTPASKRSPVPERFPRPGTEPRQVGLPKAEEAARLRRIKKLREDRKRCQEST